MISFHTGCFPGLEAPFWQVSAFPPIRLCVNIILCVPPGWGGEKQTERDRDTWKEEASTRRDEGERGGNQQGREKNGKRCTRRREKPPKKRKKKRHLEEDKGRKTHKERHRNTYT